MSEITDIVDSLENKIQKLFQKMEGLEKSNQELQSELTKSLTVIRNQSEQIEQMKQQYDTLKIANSLLGSDDNKRDTKLKINSLIREIDYCIAQLSD
ncbi:hypothetical protein [Flavobacterium sp. '19STA2R22 D10 B1']|uniref:hypothetical protein n=1 Tax=Flavobacterium aerium TaxID=3037261 RepID=UPI00278BFCAE|nr:hypothetical protein [Flavobacterium sp. '19STA2R22 D10 B1']